MVDRSIVEKYTDCIMLREFSYTSFKGSEWPALETIILLFKMLLKRTAAWMSESVVSVL